MAPRIVNGSIIRLPSGGSFEVIRLLNPLPGKVTTSKDKAGRETVELRAVRIQDSDLVKIALVRPHSRVFSVKNGRTTPVKVRLGLFIPAIVKCTNPNCVTNQPREPAKEGFLVVRIDPLVLQCVYCERYVDNGKVSAQLLGS